MSGATVSTRAADLLRESILSGKFPPGARLPSERALSSRLGISRTALRDALQALRATGLLEAHVGRGWFVTNDRSTAQSVSAAMAWLSLHRDDLESLNEVRQLLEPRAVQTIPKGATARVAANAEAIVERQAQALRRSDFEATASLDADFHSCLISQTPNEPLRVLADQLISLARRPSAAIYEIPGAAANSISEHRQIVSALHEGDTQLASRLVRKHSRSASRYALARLEKQQAKPIRDDATQGFAQPDS